MKGTVAVASTADDVGVAPESDDRTTLETGLTAADETADAMAEEAETAAEEAETATEEAGAGADATDELGAGAPRTPEAKNTEQRQKVMLIIVED